jgi:hypothetical protein
VIRVGETPVRAAAGYHVIPEMAALMTSRLAQPGVIAVTGPILLTTHDGVHRGVWRPAAVTPAEVLADPRNVPPVWAARAVALASDPNDPFDNATAWLAAISTPTGSVAVLDCPIATRDGSHAGAFATMPVEQYLEAFRAFLERHRAVVESHLQEILV